MPIFYRGLGSCRMFCSVVQEVTTLNFRYKTRKNTNAKILQDICECSYIHAYEIIKRHPVLQELDAKRIRDAARVLREFQFGAEEIKDCPRVLSILPITIEHHLLVLKESGFPRVSLRSIVNYRSIVKRKISLLKIYGLLPEDANVSRNFLTTLEAPENVFQTVETIIDINSDDNYIFILRDIVMKCYLKWRLDASQGEIEHIFSTYARMGHKSLQLTRKTLSILLDELQYDKNHITKNGYLIQAHPDHLSKIIKNFPYLAGKPIRDVLYARPPMAAASYENFIEILSALKKAGIPEEYIVRTRSIFNLSGRRVRERLPSLDPKQMSPEMKAFMIEEKFLQVLVHYENFNHRVTFLSSLDHSSSLPQVASFRVLLGPQKDFEQFVKGLAGPCLGHDVVNYLVKSLRGLSGDELDVTPLGIRELLKKNPNWRNVPLSEVRASFEMLCKKGYKPEEMLSSIPIVLYSSHMIEYHLENLSSQPEVLECFQLNGILENDFLVKDHDKSDLEVSKNSFASKMKREDLIHKYTLPLCLYFLERGYHFSGDGIWFRK